MLLVSLISYIDRNTLALLIPTIMKETHLSAEQYGFIVAAFSVAYMISNPLWGAAIDRLGLRIGMMAAVTIWTMASMSHALAGGFLSFAIARTALGLGEGATFPGGLRAVVQTLRPAEQARGHRPGLQRRIARRDRHSHRHHADFSAVGMAAGVSLHRRDRPGLADDVVFVSRRDDVRNWKPEPAAKPPRRTALQRPASLELHPGVRFGRDAARVRQLRGGPLFEPGDGQGPGLPGKGALDTAARLGSRLFFWGWLVDRMTAAGIPKMTTVRRLMFASLFLSLPLAAVPWMTQTWMVLLELFFAMFVIVGFVVPSVSYATHVYSPERAGLIAGMGAGSYGAIVALTMPVFGRLFDMHRYDIAFAVAAILPTLGYFGWYWINRADFSPSPES